MRGATTIVAAALALLAAAAPGAAAAADDPDPGPRIDNFEVSGGGSWTAATVFDLRWDVRSEGAQATSVALRILGEAFGSDPPFHLMAPPQAEMTRELEIPPAPGSDSVAPGIYKIEVWARAPGRDGPAEQATLMIDNRQPGPAAPRFGATWHPLGAAPTLRIGHPPGPLPLSGIRGYAVSLRRDSGTPPCAGPDRCSLDETDLVGGIADDEVSLGVLPEGLYAVSVVAVSNTGMRSGETKTAFVGIDATPPDLALEGIGDGWSNQPVRVLARASDPQAGMAASGPNGARTTIAVDGGTPTAVPGAEAAAVVSGSGIHTVAAGARDAVGNVRGSESAAPPRTGVVRIDEEPPAVAFTRAADPADPELLEAVLRDSLSGPAAGGVIGVRPLGSDQAFEPLPTSAAGGRLSARWDSDSYPRGSYEFRAAGHDGAGNLGTSTRRANGAALVLANPLKVPTAIRFGFGGRRLVWHRCVRSGESRRCRREVIESFGGRPAARVVPYGRGVQVGGQAVSAAGAPLAGVAVELVETFDPGASATQRVTALRTGTDGTFFARLAPGPSRHVEARFAGSNELTRSGSRLLRLGVRTAVVLRASTSRVAVGGRPLVFRGRVLHSEATVPAYGRPVHLQFRLPGMPWTDFRTVQTDRLGRYRFPYSFSDDDSRGVRFLFRAYAPPQPGWPYEPAASRPLAVTGR